MLSFSFLCHPCYVSSDSTLHLCEQLLIAVSGADFLFYFMFYMFRKLDITNCVENQKVLYSAHFKTSFPLLKNPLELIQIFTFILHRNESKTNKPNNQTTKNLEDFLFLMEGMVNALVESPKHGSLLGPIFSVSSQVLE